MPRILSVAALFFLIPPAYAAQPNIVVVNTDDDNTTTFKYLPNIEALVAQKGVSFINAYVSYPLCAPSRASLFTGAFPHTNGVQSNKNKRHGGWLAFKPLEDNMLAKWLKATGYQTALFGKYINEYSKSSEPAPAPSFWTRWFGAAKNAEQPPPYWDRWFAFTREKYNHATVNDDGLLVKEARDEYSTDVIANKAVDYIKASGRTPFFLYIAPMAPHTEGEDASAAIPAPRYRTAPVPDLATVADPSWNENDVSDKPSWLQARSSLSDSEKAALNELWKSRVRSMMAVDDLVKDVIDALQASGKLDSTYIIFTSDNGYCLGEHRVTRKSAHYDCSSKVPLVIRGPTVPENQTRSQIVNNLDVTATILDWSGASPGLVQEGRSLAPLIANASAPWRSALLIEAMDPQLDPEHRYKAVRSEKFKYVRYESGFEELYDLSVDPWELENKASDQTYASDLAKLRSVLGALKNCSGTGCWAE